MKIGDREIDVMKEVMDLIQIVLTVLTEKTVGFWKVKVKWITLVVWTQIAMMVYIIAHIESFLGWYGGILTAIVNFVQGWFSGGGAS